LRAAEPRRIRLESALDHVGQAQARALFAEPSTSSFTRPNGLSPLVIDDPRRGAPRPEVSDRELHAHRRRRDTRSVRTATARARAYRDTSSRLGRLRAELANHDRFALSGEPARLGETFVLVTGDHGMENQDLRPGRHDEFDGKLSDSDIEYVRQETFVYLLTLDVAIASAGELASGQPAQLTFTVTDSDPALRWQPDADRGRDGHRDLRLRRGERRHRRERPGHALVHAGRGDAAQSSSTRTATARSAARRSAPRVPTRSHTDRSRR
jgi:hypothetical protein